MGKIMNNTKKKPEENSVSRIATTSAKSKITAGIINLKKKQLINVLKTELNYVSELFDILDIASLNHGRRNVNEEDDDCENEEILDIPEKKIFQKNSSKKGSSQGSSKNKPFPHSIEDLEKELEELKGTTMTYQKKLRKKGLQSRLVKKKRKEDIKQQKATLKLGKKHKNTVNGHTKLMKPVYNSDGNVVSNKFDFADNKIKRDGKKKLGGVNSELNVHGHEAAVLKHYQSNKKNIEKVISFKNKQESNSLEESEKHENVENKLPLDQGPVFNKDNKMMFSKVFLPENNNKKARKNTGKDPKKILDKIKEDTKKISELEKEDKDKAATLKEKHKWAAALKRASGEKVKDDPELLKKSISREKNKKMRSQKKWQERTERVQKEKDDRQKKRTENIKARKNEKKKRKMKKAIKKGSYVQV